MRRWRTSGDHPRDAGSHPSKSSPRRQPEPHPCGPLPSCRYRPCPPSPATEVASRRSWRTRGRGASEEARWHRPSSRVPVMLRSARERTPTSPRRAVVTGEPAADTASTDRLIATAPKHRRTSRSIPGEAACRARRREAGFATGARRRHREPFSSRSREPLPTRPNHRGGRADPSRRRERPTSRPCSVDESVVSPSRCRRGDTRSFHGLCSPPRCSSRPLQPGRMPVQEPDGAVAPRRPVSLAAGRIRPPRAPLTSLPRFPPAALPERLESRRSSRGASPGPKPSPSAAPFQRGVRSLGPRSQPSRGRSRRGAGSSVAGVCPEAKS